MYSARERNELATAFGTIALSAGRAILDVGPGERNPRSKSDASPVTAADLAAERVIADALARLLPGMQVISEERADSHAPVTGGSYLLVDPLDGTREYLAGIGEYTVNIALLVAGEPVAGCVYAPALGELYCAGAEARRAHIVGGAVAAETSISVRPVPATGAVVLVSRSHLDAQTRAWAARLDNPATQPLGSSLKFCRIAAAEADLYPRFGPTMAWDTAAGHAVLVAAGGSVVRDDGVTLSYPAMPTGWRNPGFLACGGERGAP